MSSGTPDGKSGKEKVWRQSEHCCSTWTTVYLEQFEGGLTQSIEVSHNHHSGSGSQSAGTGYLSLIQPIDICPQSCPINLDPIY